MKQEYVQTPQELLTQLESTPEGLSSQEAAARLEKYGPNKLKDAEKPSLLQRFIQQLKDPMLIILIIAAAVSAVTNFISHESFAEVFIILIVVLLNAVLGVFQESKAEAAIEALQTMTAATCKVLRDGKQVALHSDQLVPGDVVLLEAGDAVPADGRLLESASLKIEEAALTGESVPVNKIIDALGLAKGQEDVPLGDRKNMCYMGSTVVYGRGKALITRTGMDTEMGKIAGALANTEQEQTPLQRQLEQLSGVLSKLVLGICLFIFVFDLIVAGSFTLDSVLSTFMVAVSLAVAAIPEGLATVVTVVLSIGVTNMSKRNAVIRRLTAVETLGCTQVICSDKTGTLTQNRMTLVKLWVNGEPELETVSASNTPTARELLRYGALCCDGSVVYKEDGTEQHIGDPTETSILVAAHKNGMEQDELNRQYPRLAELPFDSDRKLMTSVNQIDGKIVAIVKGAFDMMAARCVSGNLEAAKEKNDEMSRGALRVLAVGYKILEEAPEDPTSEELENGLTLLGLVGMIDPPRPEAKAAVATCRQAGIKPVMITGDHVVTASAIAKELGILGDGDKAITGAQLDAMTEEQLDQEVEHISVYARVSPENKIRIVKAWQRKGQVVSMTGDGVNDAPALKAADIGCAMGITGTDVAKGAADMTLTDDNFATIVDAVREGRGIYANIKKVVGFLLGTNIGEVLTVFFAMILWHKTPLLSMQLLWINLVTDSLPAISLGMEAVEADVMDHKPKPKSEGIFAHGLGIQVVLQGCMFALLTLAAFVLGQRFGGSLEAGQTMAFMVLALTQIVQSFNMRSQRSLFAIGPFSNKKLNGAALLSLALVCLVLFTPVRIAFGLVLLPGWLYLVGLGLILVPLPVMELAKAIGLVRHRH